MQVQDKIQARETEKQLLAFNFSKYNTGQQNSNSWHLKFSDEWFKVRDFEETHWLFDFIFSSQSSLTLDGVALQTWNISRISQHELQIICRDLNEDVLLAKLVKRRFPLSNLTVTFTKSLE